MEQPCPQCGHYVADTEEFCPNPKCGAYLGWHRAGAASAPPLGPPTMDPPPDPPARPARTPHVASLSTQLLEVDPGDSAELTITVTNTGTVVDEVQIAVVSELASCTRVTPSAVQVYPGQHATARVTVAPPVDDGLRAGNHHLRIRLTSDRAPGHTELETQVVVGARVGMSARLVPPHTTGRSARFRQTVEVTNPGNTPLHVTLQPRDDYGRIRWVRPPPPTVVPPRATGATELAARTRRNWWGDTDPRPFEVTVQGEPEVADEDAVEQRLPGRRDQEATLSGWHIWVLAASVLAVLVLLLAPLGLALLDDDDVAVEPDDSGQVTLPDLVGTDVDEATDGLEGAGLQVEVVEEFSEEDAGRVLAQDPSAGTTVDPGSTVTLLASLGESPDGAVCDQAAEARGLLTDQGLTEDSAEAAGEVVDSANTDGVTDSLVAGAAAVSSALEAQDGAALGAALDQMLAICGQ